MPTNLPSFAPAEFTSQQVSEFIDNGFLMLRNVFSAEVARQTVRLVWNDMEEAPENPATWLQAIRIVKKVLVDWPINEILTDRYRTAIDDLCGAGRWVTNPGVGYWINLFPDPPSTTRRPQPGDWHIDTKADGENIHSRDLGLMAMEFFTDIDPGGGGTAVRVGSHRYIARLAAENDFRLTADELSERALTLTTDLPTFHVTARAGDVLLMHPFTMHASSSNLTSRVRIAANRPVSLFEPMMYQRLNSNSYSPAEWAVIRAMNERAMNSSLSNP